MRTFPTERIDQLALVWLAMPRKESRINGFSTQLKHVPNWANDAKQLAQESIARLRKDDLIQPGNLLKLTEEGRRRALEALGVPRLPSMKQPFVWAKKVLLLRSIGTEPKPAAVNMAGQADFIAACVLARRHHLEQKPVASVSAVLAVLARRALGLEETPSFQFDEVFPAVFLRSTSTADHENGSGDSAVPPSSATALKLADCDLSDFANIVNDAARSSRTGRWHGAVFISHVWNALRARGEVGITFEHFQQRLVEAFRADLIELSRADLVDAMPAADVSASETVYSGARFHFIRLEQLAS